MVRPRMLMCYLCGREYGSKSLPIHIPQCQKKWEAAEALKPKSQRKPVPKPPADLDRAIKMGDNEAIDAFNEQMYDTWQTEALTPCPHCGRTFSDEAFKHHRKACTADKPFRPAGTGLTKASLSVRMEPGAIAGTNADNTHLRDALHAGVPITKEMRASYSPGQGEDMAASRADPLGRTGAAPMRQLSSPSKRPQSPAKSARGPGPGPASGAGAASSPRPAATSGGAPFGPPTSATAKPRSASRTRARPEAAEGSAASTSRAAPAGSSDGAMSVTQEDFVAMAKAVGAWELKQELMINNPAILQDVAASGKNLEEELRQTAGSYGMRPADVVAAFQKQAYLDWTIT